MRTPHMM